MESKKINLVLTEEIICQALIGDQINYLVKNNWTVNVFCKKNKGWSFIKNLQKKKLIKFYDIPFERKFNLLKDIRSFFVLFYYLYKKEGLIVYSTPKASLIASICCFLLNKKLKIYFMRGRVYENYKGLKLFIFEFLEKIICRISDDIVFLTNETKEIFINKNFTKKENSHIIFNGSSNGIDIEYYKKASKNKFKLRMKNNYMTDDFIILFAARLCVDKGIYDFIHVTKKLLSKYKNLKLILIGKNEMKFHPNNFYDKKEIKSIRQIDWKDDISDYYAVSDILLLPSHREGFGNVYAEASATGCVPIGYNIMGVRTAVKNNFSGLLVDFKDRDKLIEKIEGLILNKNNLNYLRKNGFNYVRKFDKNKFMNKLINFYEERVFSLHSK